ncbi:MAG: 5-methylthioadenosine/S-adenosylhomocysteine deaminase [Halanaerobiales bacterium]|nr:5-methylthioadenosine/S-adenosylhomocysteine deaminase [Halanaerobiales bacterium]
MFFMAILIKNIDEIYTVTDNPVIKDGYIVIEENIIKEIDTSDNFQRDEKDFTKVINGRGKLALPGLINTHTHAGMTLLRGYADDLPLQTWLKEKIWPYEAGLSADDIYWGSMLAIIEMLQTGTTTFTDMYFQMDRVARAVEETGIRGVLTQGLIEANDGLEGLEDAKRFSREWHQQADGRITTMLAPHAPYTCSAGYLKKVIDISVDLELPINIHVAETRVEYDDSLRKYGLSPVKYLAELGVLERPVIAAHCVYVDDGDLEIMADKDVGVAYNPSSNMKLGSGIAPVTKMLEYGINVGIGTDGVASNNNLDLIEEARIGSYLQKVNGLDPTSLNTDELLSMLTLSGARALRLQRLGQLKEGNLADIILVNLNDTSFYYPHHHNLSNLFYAGSGRDVSTVIINGQVIMEDNELLTVDQERVFYEVERITT